jgi:hypothetical protein
VLLRGFLDHAVLVVHGISVLVTLFVIVAGSEDVMDVEAVEVHGPLDNVLGTKARDKHPGRRIHNFVLLVLLGGNLNRQKKIIGEFFFVQVFEEEITVFREKNSQDIIF